jgi:ABC-type molybdate transport system substrate-binding protein
LSSPLVKAEGIACTLTCARASANEPCPSGQDEVIIFHAGSLANAFTPLEQAFVCQTRIQVIDCQGGSLDLAGALTAGGYAADIYAPADYLDIDLFLKPGGYADYNILFAEGKMVLTYTTSSTGADTITQPAAFHPPDAIPDVVDDCGRGGGPAVPASCWFSILTQPGVVIGTGHLYLDPSAYRNPMIFMLAEELYGLKDLATALLEHDLISPAALPASTFGLKGTNATYPLYDYVLSYEHSALALAKTNPNYRYVNLPDEINLGAPEQNDLYRRAVVVQPGVPGTTPFVKIPGTRVIWGATVLHDAPHSANGIQFLAFLLGQMGTDALRTNGPTPISPAVVSPGDYPKLPASLQALVRQAPVFSPGHESGADVHEDQ